MGDNKKCKTKEECSAKPEAKCKAPCEWDKDNKKCKTKEDCSAKPEAQCKAPCEWDKDNKKCKPREDCSGKPEAQCKAPCEWDKDNKKCKAKEDCSAKPEAQCKAPCEWDKDSKKCEETLKEKIIKALKRLLDLLKRKINEAKRNRRLIRQGKKTEGENQDIVKRQEESGKSCSWLDGKFGELLTALGKLNYNSITDQDGK